jgi:hypothetical protein
MWFYIQIVLAIEVVEDFNIITQVDIKTHVFLYDDLNEEI